MTAEKPEKSAWIKGLPKHGSNAADLAKLVEEDGDPAETAYYEAAADPVQVKNEQERRRYRAMYRRRLRHLLSRQREQE